MNIDLKYTELRLVHTLVTAHRQELFKNLVKAYPNLKKKSFDELIDIQKKFNEERNPFCDEGQCGLILDKIEVIEDRVRENINA